MSLFKRYAVDFWVISVILLFSLFAWWPTRVMPYHWDSAGFVINSAFKLLNSNFQPLIVPDSDFAHPPLLIGLLALSWKLFGHTQLVSHLFMFPFLPLLLMSTYYLSKKLSNSTVAIATTTLLAVTPVVLSEYSLIYIDLPMSGCVILGTGLWLSGKRYWGLLFLSLASLIKFPALVVVAVLMIWHIVKRQYRLAALLSIPFVSFFVWLLYHYQITGWWLIRPNRGTVIPTNLMMFWNSLRFVAGNFFIEQNRVWLWVLSVTGLAGLYNAHKLYNLKSLYLPLTILLAGVSFFIITGEFTMRYGMFLLVFSYFIASYIIYEVLASYKVKVWYFAVIALPVLLFFLALHPKRSPDTQFVFQPDDDLATWDAIKVGQKFSNFAQTQDPQAIFYGGFPESYQLTQPYQGYVSKTLYFKECKDFRIEPSSQQIIILHPYSPMQIMCNQLLQNLAAKPLARFEKNGKWVQLFLVNATESAKIRKPLPR